MDSRFRSEEKTVKKIIAIVVLALSFTACTMDGSHSSEKGCELVRKWPKEMADYDGYTNSWYLWAFDESTPGAMLTVYEKVEKQ